MRRLIFVVLPVPTRRPTLARRRCCASRKATTATASGPRCRLRVIPALGRRSSPRRGGPSLVCRVGRPRVTSAIAPIGRASACGDTRRTDPLAHVNRLRAAVLAEHMRVRVQRHRRRMPQLLGELHDRRSLLADQQRGERVPEVVRAWTAEAGAVGRRVEVAVAPVVPVIGAPRLAVRPWEDEPARARCSLALGEVLRERVEQVDGPVDAVGLLALEAAVADRLFDQEGAVADVAPFEAERLAGPQAGVGEDADQRDRAVVALVEQDPAQTLDVLGRAARSRVDDPGGACGRRSPGWPAPRPTRSPA
jgi:hypothetical protein